MAFDNYYPNRKDNRRKYYTKAKQCCRGCRNHGGCPYCEGNRFHQMKKAKLEAESKVREYEEQ